MQVRTTRPLRRRPLRNGTAVTAGRAHAMSPCAAHPPRGSVSACSASLLWSSTLPLDGTRRCVSDLAIGGRAHCPSQHRLQVQPRLMHLGAALHGHGRRAGAWPRPPPLLEGWPSSAYAASPTLTNGSRACRGDSPPDAGNTRGLALCCEATRTPLQRPAHAGERRHRTAAVHSAGDGTASLNLRGCTGANIPKARAHVRGPRAAAGEWVSGAPRARGPRRSVAATEMLGTPT